MKPDDFQLLADNLPALCWIADGDGSIIWYNRRWYDYTGTTWAEMEGWGWTTVHDPAVLPGVMTAWKTAIELGEPFEQTFPLRGADGRFRSFLTRVVPYRDSGGTVLRWFGNNIDISEHERVSESLRASEEALRALNDTTQERVVAAVDDIAKNCGAVAVGATDAAERVKGVAASIGAQLQTLDAIEGVMSTLVTKQQENAFAAADAMSIAQRSGDNLRAGAVVIGEAVGEFASLTGLVMRMEDRIAQFRSAMDDVRHATTDITGLARTTKVLALNATIEASRSGVDGAAFAVVADEMKRLATSTKSANDLIEERIGSLAVEATTITTELSVGIEKAQQAQSRFRAIDVVLEEVGRLSDVVREQAAGVAQASGAVEAGIQRVRTDVAGFLNDARANRTKLDQAEDRVNALEEISNEMFNRLVTGGFSQVDQSFVRIAVAARDEVSAIVERAIERGEIDPDAVFDTEYQPVPGSAPAQFLNRFNRFADHRLQPVLDAVAGSDPRIEGTVCSDVNGYLVTHQSVRSFPQRAGDIDWNDRHCRNRRILMDQSTARAVKSTAPFMMSVYQLDRAIDPVLLKSVAVPLYIAGRRWGNFEIAYRGE